MPTTPNHVAVLNSRFSALADEAIRLRDSWQAMIHRHPALLTTERPELAPLAVAADQFLTLLVGLQTMRRAINEIAAGVDAHVAKHGEICR